MHYAKDILKPGAWEGERVVILGGGPSLIDYYSESYADRMYVIGANQATMLYPDVSVHQDPEFHKRMHSSKRGRLHGSSVCVVKAFRGMGKCDCCFVISDSRDQWTMDFCQSVAESIKAGRRLTDKQMDVINKNRQRYRVAAA